MANNVLPIPLPTDPISKDFYLEVQKGNVAGHKMALISGRNPDVEMGAPESVWDAGGLASLSGVGEQYSIASSSVDDSLAGTGAQKMQLNYLDDNYDEQQEVIELNGNTPVLTVATNILRFIGAFVIQRGSALSNQGIITFNGAALRGQVNINLNRALHGLFTIPNGKTGYVIYGYSTIQKNKDAEIVFEITDGDNGIYYPAFPIEIYQNSFGVASVAPVLALPARTEINPVCSTDNNDTRVSITYQILLVDD